MELRKIVVGVDRSTRGEHALRVAAQLAAAADASLIALTVVDAASASQPEALAGLVAGITRARHRVRLGAPMVEIARFAEQEAADLIVLGRCATTPAALRRTGTPTEGTLRRARVPVLIVPEGHQIAGRVLAAVAADPEAVGVLSAALSFADLLHARVHALHVESEYALAGAQARSGLSVLTATMTRLPPPHAAPELVIRRGDPAREILAAIPAQRCDLVVIGRRRGSAALDREANGVAARVLAQAACAVLAVPL